LPAQYEPLKKASVGLWSNERESSYEAFTDAEGRFKLKNVQPGRYRFWASHDGYVTAAYQEKTSRRRAPTLILTGGQELRDVVFRLQRTAVMTGRVVDEDGEPVLRAQIRLAAGQGSERVIRAKTEPRAKNMVPRAPFGDGRTELCLAQIDALGTFAAHLREPAHAALVAAASCRDPLAQPQRFAGDPLVGPRLLRRLRSDDVLRPRLERGITLVELAQRAAIQPQRPARQAPEEGSVVADQEETAGICGKTLFQPFDRWDVEMIGRFVEQQQIRLSDQRAHRAILAAADDNPHFRVMGVEHSDVYPPLPQNDPSPETSSVSQAA